MGAEWLAIGLLGLMILAVGAEAWNRLAPARQRQALQRETDALLRWLSAHDPELRHVGGRVRQLQAALADRLGDPTRAPGAALRRCAVDLRRRQRQTSGLLPEQDQIAVRLVAAWLEGLRLDRGDALRIMLVSTLGRVD